MSENPLKRISLLVKEEQYESLSNRGVNVSGLIRDLIDDYLSDHKITIAVSEETRALYEKIVSNTGTEDDEVEVYFRESLKDLLANKIKEMERLQKDVFGKQKR